MPQFKLVTRKESDPPLDPAIADAIRTASYDPAKFTLALSDAAAGMPEAPFPHAATARGPASASRR